MHGLINKSVQTFLRAHYAEGVWQRVAQQIGLGPEGFEAMLHYDDALTEGLLDAAAAELDRSRASLLEDIGAFLAMRDPARRLLRFGGADYLEFLHSLEELPGRGRLALPDLTLPDLRLRPEGGGRFVLEVSGAMPDWGAVVAGLLRAMADDYGSLAVIEGLAPLGGVERLQIFLLDTAWTEGRRFALATPLAGEGA